MSECGHSQNAQIFMPSLTGGKSNGCPFVWCRMCGAIWLPHVPSFERAFERHEKRRLQAPVDGIGNVEGYWILPGLGAIIRPVTG